MKSDVAHYEGLTYWGPIRPERMEAIFDLVLLSPESRVLDLGCGRGEILARLAERFESNVVGVDRSEAAIALARRQLQARAPKTDSELMVLDVAEFKPAEPFDLVSWVGGPYVGENFESTLATLTSWTRHGGYVLVGHGFWDHEPPTDYLDASGIDKGEFGGRLDTMTRGREAGLTLLYSSVSSRDEWDAFEGRILFNWEEHCRLGASDEDRRTLERKRAWNDLQQRWGRTAMGFGLYLFRRPATT
ncbi:MAG: cyclopropane-fatty-acyl-phospholipid synthase family protein [Polyangiales bacterium]